MGAANGTSTAPSMSSKLRRAQRKANRQSTRDTLIAEWDAEAVAEEVDRAVREYQNNTNNNVNAIGGDWANTDSKNKYSTGWMTQYRVLVHRAMKNSRSAIFTPLNMIKSAVLGIVVGLLWFQLDYTEKTIHDRTSYVFFTMTYVTLHCC